MKFTFILLIALVSAAVSHAAERPNFVIVLADDMGYGDPGYHGGKAKTPNIDKLAAEGVKLEAHYVHPMCSPTRAALLTGRYASRFGVTAAQNEQALPFGTPTIASILGAAGYDTALTGKWHLGSTPATSPNKFGFDHSYGCLAGGCTPDTHEYKMGPFQHTWHRNGEQITEEGHVTDLITREAVKWIGSRSDKPFFLYIPFTAVHVPIAEPERWLKVNAHIEDEGQRLFAADVSHLDDCVGQIIAALEKKAVRDNTMVLFLSDNGAHPAISNREDKYPGTENRPHVKVGGSNTPLRGWKTEVYEGGVRTPAIVHWPARFKPGTITQPLSVTDWLPTLCGIANAKLPNTIKGDGADITLLLANPGITMEKGTHPVYSVAPGFRAQMLRRGPWKLITGKEKGGGELRALYNLDDDIAESKNLANEQPAITAELAAIMKHMTEDDNSAVAPGSGVKTKE